MSFGVSKAEPSTLNRETGGEAGMGVGRRGRRPSVPGAKASASDTQLLCPGISMGMPRLMHSSKAIPYSSAMREVSSVQTASVSGGMWST